MSSAWPFCVRGGRSPAPRSLLIRVRGDLDGLRLDGLRLRQGHLEDPVGERCADGVGVDLHRQGEGPLELTGTTLLAQPTLLGHVAGGLGLTRERDGVAGDADVDVLSRQTREVGTQVIRVLRLPEVHRHRGLAGQAIRPDDALLEEAVHGVPEGHEIAEWSDATDYLYNYLVGDVFWLVSVAASASSMAFASSRTRSAASRNCRSIFTPARFTPRCCVR